MAQPVYNDVDHGQQSWDADLQANIDQQRVSVIIPEYANFAALPSAAANEHTLVATTDESRLWISDGTVWHPQDGRLHSIIADVTVVTDGTEQDLDSHTIPANTVGKNNDVLKVTSDFSDTVSVDPVIYKFYVGGVLVGTHTTNNVNAKVLFRSGITRRAASGGGSTRLWIHFVEFNSTGVQVDESFSSAVTAIDWTAAVILKMSIQEAAAGSINLIQHQFLIEHVR